MSGPFGARSPDEKPRAYRLNDLNEAGSNLGASFSDGRSVPGTQPAAGPGPGSSFAATLSALDRALRRPARAVAADVARAALLGAYLLTGAAVAFAALYRVDGATGRIQAL